MKCPFCGHLEDKVIDSRTAATGEVIRRRRECEGCTRRFTSYERVEDVLPAVVKKDGKREAFDRQKLVRGLRIACNKRPVSTERIEAVADAIEQEVQSLEGREVRATELGERVMRHLRELDGVAYVRFASVYQSFDDLEQLKREVDTLIAERADTIPGQTSMGLVVPPKRVGGVVVGTLPEPVRGGPRRASRRS